jgi:hypothetical protein
VDWSYELLSDQESTVLDRLSVFASGFTLDAAESVASDDDIDAFDVLEHVSALVDKSLVVADPGEETYRLLETIRQYAAGRLATSGSAEEVRARHATYYRILAAEISPLLSGSGDLAAIERIAADIENLRLMLDWYRDDHQAAVVTDVIWTLADFWWWRGHQLEMIGRLEDTIDRLGEDHLRLSRAHALLAWMKSAIGFVGVPEHAEQSAAQAELAGIPTPVYTLAALATYFMTSSGDSQRAVEAARVAMDAADATGDDYLAVYFRLVGLTYTGLLAPGTDETLRLAEELRGDVDRTGSDALRQMWLQGVAVALLPVDRDRALELLDDALAVGTRENLQEGVATTEFWRGIVLFTVRRYADAAIAWRRSLLIHHDRGNRRGMTNVLSGVAGLADRTGRSQAAALLLEGLRAARDEFGLRGSANERYAERRIEEHLRERATSEGSAFRAKRLGVEATIDLALDVLDEIAGDSSA